ncbi:MAG: hypothetical protein Q4F83_01285 [Eubacteriales bacterium]|nr:hypothetical protein [Eubacteriales bacterium]
MIKRSRLFLLLALCGVLSLSGCRKKIAETETETETQSETVSETETEKVTEKESEKETQKATVSTNKNTKTTEKTTVKPSTINSGNTNNTTNNTTTPTDSYGTDQCPYCYQQISLAPNGDGTTVYSVHVAQEKAWADTYGYGDTPPTEAQQQPEQPTTEQPAQNNTNDIAQCGYCYQWFTVSDGSYSAHVAAENATLGLPEGTEYIQCPNCGYSYPKGSLYDNHVCVTE